MGLPKGRTNNTKGRTPGSKNKKTIEWEEFGRQLFDAGLPRILAILESGDDDDVMKIMIPMIEYFKPKLARTENNNTNDNQTTIYVTWEDAKPIHTITATSSQPTESIEGSSTF